MKFLWLWCKKLEMFSW